MFYLQSTYSELYSELNATELINYSKDAERYLKVSSYPKYFLLLEFNFSISER